MTLDFVRPLVLLLLPPVLAALVWLARGSRAYLPRDRWRLALGLRLLGAGLLVVALAGPLVSGPTDRLAVMFLLDGSDSVGPASRAGALEWVRQALGQMGERDRAGVVVFGADAVLERAVGPERSLPEPSSVVDRSHTNLAAAIRLGVAALPTDAARRIVLLSDGNENLEQAATAARFAASARVPIAVVPLASASGAEALIRAVETPQYLREGEAFSSRITIESSADGVARLHLLTDGRLTSSQEIQLSRGLNSFVVPHEALDRGFHVFRWQLEPGEDTFAENNEGGSFAIVTGRPRVLVLEGEVGEGRFLAEALRASGLLVDVAAPTTAPLDPTGLRGYDSVVLVNVPADRLTAGQQKALASHVRDFGGGLVVIGGDRSYGVGGYARTPLEEALPVRMDLRGRRLSASVALVLVIDTSGSMSGGLGGVAKIEVAKEAALRVTELLGEGDQLGVIAFEDVPRWAVELGFLTNLAEAQTRIGEMAPGGGTNVYPALEQAYEALAKVDAKVKHVILLTDGLTPAADWDGLTRRYRAAEISLSTIAIGGDADFALLQRLADDGKGRYYEGNDPFEIPQLVVKETRTVSRVAIVEEDFQPIPVGASPILEGLDGRALPPLRGYVSTTPKPSAQVLLVSREVDPLLAEWQYGLGRVVAWTSDAKNRWAANWVGWPQFAQFWSQAVKRTFPSPVSRTHQVELRAEGDRLRVTVDAMTEDRRYIDFLPPSATVVTPKERRLEVRFVQTAPGRYEGSFPSDGEGAYLLEVVQRDAQGQVLAQQPAGYVVPYSPEYRASGTNAALLADLANRTGGKVLTSPAEAFAHDLPTTDRPREAWPYLAALAALLFLLDVAARRLRLSLAEAGELWRRVRPAPARRPAMAAAARLGAARRVQRTGGAALGPAGAASVGAGSDGAGAAAAPVGSAGMARLLAAKQRAARRRG